MSAPAPSRLLACTDDTRRATLRAHDVLQGIDYLEVVAPDQRALELHFVPKATAAGRAALGALIADLAAHPQRIRILGGERVVGIAVTAASPGDPGVLHVSVDRAGDFSTYTLRIEASAIDPAYAEVDFSFKAGCPSRFDCGPRDVCEPEPLAEPPIDYLAKDFASFRQALLDLLAGLAPDWRERHEADLMVTLVELLAYAGDLISYEQDAVATEAYLDTARRRVSVRRHARLVDYRMHDGASAHAWVHVALRNSGDVATVPAGTRVLTGLAVSIGPHAAPHPPVLAFTEPQEQIAARTAAAAVFETVEALAASGRLNTIAIHTWDDRACCLPRGATAVHLAGDLAHVPGVTTDAWRLRPGSRLLLEEIAGAETGLPADADPRHRQVVTLTLAERARDEVLGRDLTRVAWSDEDALGFPLCISVVREPGGPANVVGVARGNLVLADHGDTIADEWHPTNPGWTGPPPPAPPGPGLHVPSERPLRLTLREGPLSQRLPAGPSTPASVIARAADPHTAAPQVKLRLGRTAADAADWSAASEGLFDRDGFARAFAVEVEDDLRPTLRFGDDVYGMAPADGSYAAATYRVGAGSAGNVGAESLRHLLTTAPLPPLQLVRNPLRATGGVDPEPAAHVKRIAPDAFRATQLRAVTEADYGEVTERHPAVSHARATFRWTGSWHTVFITVDPKGGGALGGPLRASILAWVERFTQAGYDLELAPPIYVPLDLVLYVCAARGHLRPDVELAVLEALSARPGGFFDPDRWSFGDPLYLSALCAAVEAVPGVDSVTLERFSRAYDDDPAPARPVTRRNVDRGLIAIDRLEVLRVDNDSSLPERGVLRVTTGGGT